VEAMRQLLIGFAAFAAFVNVQSQAETFVIGTWPNELASIPCKFWKRNADGSWHQVNSTILFGRYEMRNNNFTGPNEIEVIDEKCGGRV
jgi:hypothetical protein